MVWFLCHRLPILEQTETLLVEAVYLVAAVRLGQALGLVGLTETMAVTGDRFTYG